MAGVDVVEGYAWGCTAGTVAAGEPCAGCGAPFILGSWGTGTVASPLREAGVPGVTEAGEAAGCLTSGAAAGAGVAGAAVGAGAVAGSVAGVMAGGIPRAEASAGPCDFAAAGAAAGVAGARRCAAGRRAAPPPGKGAGLLAGLMTRDAGASCLALPCFAEGAAGAAAGAAGSPPGLRSSLGVGLYTGTATMDVFPPRRVRTS